MPSPSVLLKLDSLRSESTFSLGKPHITSKSTTCVFNNVNQYTAVGALSPTYSTDGNLSAYNGSTFSYDAQNRLIGVSNVSTVASFNYDGMNRRVKQTINGTATYFYFDGWNLIDERNSSNTQLAEYVHGTQVDELLMKEVSSVPIYYHQDSIGNVVALTDSGGAVVEKYKYDIYGAPTITDGGGTPLSPTDESDYGNRFMFTGREYLADIDLYDYRNRFYMPDIGETPDVGRWLQPDPLRFGAGDVNLYRYVGNNPVNWTDAFGLCEEKCSSGIWRGRINYKIGNLLLAYGTFKGKLRCTSGEDNAKVSGRVDGVGLSLGFTTGSIEVTHSGETKSDLIGQTGGFWHVGVSYGYPLVTVGGLSADVSAAKSKINAAQFDLDLPSIDTDVEFNDVLDKPKFGWSVGASFYGYTIQEAD
jgi:RHS repeat-associated protein